MTAMARQQVQERFSIAWFSSAPTQAWVRPLPSTPVRPTTNNAFMLTSSTPSIQSCSTQTARTVVSDEEIRTTIDAVGRRRTLSVDDQLDSVALRPEDERFAGVVDGPRRRRTERSAATRQCPISYFGVRVGADVQPPVYPVCSGTSARLRTWFQPYETLTLCEADTLRTFCLRVYTTLTCPSVCVFVRATTENY